MKIGIILRLLWPAAAPRFAIEETRYLRSLGHRSRLLICRESEYQFKYSKMLSELTDVKYITKGKLGRLSELIHLPTLFFLPRGARGRESVIDISSYLLLSLTLSKSLYDVVLCHDQLAGLSGYIASKIHGVPYVIYVYDPFKSGHMLGIKFKELPPRARLAQRLGRLMEKEVVENASYIVTISEKTANSMRVSLPRCQNKISTIYPGCYPVPNPNLEKKGYVLALSRWDKGRKPSFILDIAEKVKRAKFVIAGAFTPPNLKAEFKKEVRARKLSDRVKIISNLTEGEIDAVYRSASIVVRWGDEGFGMNVLEGMANACPVVLNKGLGASEIVKHGIHGFITDQIDADEFAHYISLLFEDRSLVKKMGIEAWKHSKMYTWKVHAKKLADVLKIALEKEILPQ